MYIYIYISISLYFIVFPSFLSRRAIVLRARGRELWPVWEYSGFLWPPAPCLYERPYYFQAFLRSSVHSWLALPWCTDVYKPQWSGRISGNAHAIYFFLPLLAFKTNPMGRRPSIARKLPTLKQGWSMKSTSFVPVTSPNMRKSSVVSLRQIYWPESIRQPLY